MKTDVAKLREDYTKASLDISDMMPKPMMQFSRWFEEAIKAEIVEPNAMILSTSDNHGGIDARTVLLKDYDDEGLVFYTNYMSDKATQLNDHSDCHLLFLWLDLERQIRIKGKAVKTTREQSAEYFESRPKGSQIGAWASPQSTEIPNRQYLEERVETYTKRFEGSDIIPIPDHWGGYKIIPYQMEFWQGRSSRLHDRMLYTQSGSLWKISRLAP